MARRRLFAVGMLVAVVAAQLGCAREKSPRASGFQPVGQLSGRTSDGFDAKQLVVLDHRTALGIVAYRVVNDAEGRPVRKTFYDGRLQELRSHTFEYDAAGRLEFKRRYYAGNKLFWTEQLHYWPDGGKRLVVRRTGKGVRCGETRFHQDGTATSLQFDHATGTRLISITGALVDDVDLPGGWGDQVDGLSYGITCETTTMIRCVIKSRPLRPQETSPGRESECDRGLS